MQLTHRGYSPYIYAVMFIILLYLGVSQAFSSPRHQSLLQVPTATPENYQEIERLNSLINNPSCTLPCWWNLTLEQSTLTDLQNLATANFNENFAQGPDGNYIHAGHVFLESTPNAPSGRLYFGIGFWFKQADSKVAAVGINLGHPSGSYVDYSAYLPMGVLSTYGQPDEVTLAFVSRPSYDITLKYHDLGLYIYYSMVFSDDLSIDTGIPICNDSDIIDFIRIWIETDSVTQYSSDMQQGLWPNLATRDAIEYDISGISNLSIAEFTQLFSQPDTCFQSLPPDQWVQFTPTPTPTPPVCNFSPTTPAEVITAIQNANGTPEADTICLAQNGMYTFTSAHASLKALPSITSDIKIIGNGATLTRQAGSPAFRFFEVSSNGTLTLDNLTLSGAEANADPGGAILNTGNLTVNNVTFSGNHAGTGAAIDNHRFGGTSNPITATISNSTFQNNTATYGAALDNDANATMTVTTSTFTGNMAVHDGGAIRNHGVLSLTDSQILNNTASAGGSGIFSTGSTTAHNSCISGNTTSVTSVVHVGSNVQDFAGNYWGAADGPSGAGGGSGDSVNVNINVADFLTVCPHS